MPEPYIADPNKYKRILANQGKPYPQSDYEMDRLEWDRELRKANVYTRAEFDQWQAELNRKFKESEAGWFKQLFGKLYFDLIIPKSKEYLTPKRLMKLLTNLDQLGPWMPNSTWLKILLFLDKAAEAVYKTMD